MNYIEFMAARPLIRNADGVNQTLLSGVPRTPSLIPPHEHGRDVARVALNHDITDEVLIAGIVLHDALALNDTRRDLATAFIAERVAPAVADLVCSLTKPQGGANVWRMYWRQLLAASDPRRVYIAKCCDLVVEARQLAGWTNGHRHGWLTETLSYLQIVKRHTPDSLLSELLTTCEPYVMGASA